MTPTERKLRYQKRFLTLCFEAIRQSGKLTYPAFLKLIDEYHREKTTTRGILENVDPQLLTQKVETSQSRILTAAQKLEKQKGWKNAAEISQGRQILARETKNLEALIAPFLSSSSDKNSHSELYQKLSYLRTHLLDKLSDVQFLSPQGLRVEQPQIYAEQDRRVRKYLSEIQAVTNTLVESIKEELRETSVDISSQEIQIIDV